MRTTLILASGAVWLVAVTGCGGSDSTAPTPSDVIATSTTTVETSPTTAAAPTSTVQTSTTAASTTASSEAPATTPVAAVDPNALEVVEPGDIPDNQVFVTFQSPDGVYSVDVPEGWARTENNGVVTFTDKYNSVEITSKAAASAPTVDSVKATDLTDVSSDPTYTLVDTTTVTRKGGDAVLAKFEIGSAPNSVTGKKALLSVERYVFFKNGTELILTLSGAKGADNVDPWRIVSDSVTWL
ncbi:MAG TPA: hypothetical protein VGC84_19255 [Ilumatobacteraceae bacterium]